MPGQGRDRQVGRVQGDAGLDQDLPRGRFLAGLPDVLAVPGLAGAGGAAEPSDGRPSSSVPSTALSLRSTALAPAGISPPVTMGLAWCGASRWPASATIHGPLPLTAQPSMADEA